jgi:predicted secreted Zn-dependent protease
MFRETSAVKQSPSHSTRAQEQHRDIRPTEAENLESNFLEFSDEVNCTRCPGKVEDAIVDSTMSRFQEKENMMPSKRTFSEFDDVGLHSDQRNEFKRLKTMQNDDDDEDDQLIGVFRIPQS